MVAPVILAVVAAIAGHPVQVACDADINQPPFPVTQAFKVNAWTLYGGDTIHVHPLLCDDSNAEPGGRQFAVAMNTFIHEAAHARGVRSESCAELTADIGVYDVLRRFYGIPFFSPLSQSIGAQVLAITRSLPDPAYQPELCWSSGSYG